MSLVGGIWRVRSAITVSTTGCQLETKDIPTEQLLQVYQHLKGMLIPLEAILIQRGAINPMRRYQYTVTSFTTTAKVSA